MDLINFTTMSTTELKEWIKSADHELVNAVTELCTRHDAGDLLAFFAELHWGPSPELARQLQAQLEAHHVPTVVVAAATGKTEDAIKSARKRAKASEMPDEVSVDTDSDNSDNAQVSAPPQATFLAPAKARNPGIDWDRAEALAREGKSFRQIGDTLAVHESTIRRDQGVRNAKATVDPSFDPAEGDHTIRHHEESVGCVVEPLDTLIKEIKDLLERVSGPLYTLSKRDKRRLIKLLSDFITTIDAK